MTLDPQLAGLLVATTGVGFAMAFAGIQKNALEWRRRHRVCPSCGKLSQSCSCD
jgi:hypothetical protein